MIIGESATKIPNDIKKIDTDIPWRTIIGFRNIVIHDYTNVSMGRVWEIYQKELPILHDQLTTLLKTLPPPQKI